MFRNSALALAVLIGLAGGPISVAAQEEIIGGGVYRPPNPPTGLTAPIMATFVLPGSGTNLQYGGQIGSWVSGQLSATATNRLIPIPIAGTIYGLYSNLGLVNSAATITDVINGNAGTVTCAYTPTTAPFSCNDATHSDAVNVGDTFEWKWDPHGVAWLQNVTSSVSFLLTSTSPQQGALLMGVWPGVGAQAANYLAPGGGATGNATEITISAILPEAITVTGLFALTNAAENATDAHVFTVCKNGSSTCSASPSSGMFCTPGLSASGGCCTDTTGSAHHIGGGSGPACTLASSVSFAAGDTVSVLMSCAGGTDCATVNPGIGLAYTPGVPNQAVLTAQATVALSSWFAGFNGLIVSGQFNYNIIPALGSKSIIFANLIACTSVAPGGTAARIITSQSSTAANTAPTNVSGGTVATITGSPACPGSNGLSLFGAQDTNSGHAWTAVSGGLVDNAWTLTGSPVTGNANWKTAITAKIQ
jgi:hypothetical protein